MCFSNHQMSAFGLLGGQCSGEQVWTGIQSWLPDITSREGMRQGVSIQQVPSPRGVWFMVKDRGYWMVGSNASWAMVTLATFCEKTERHDWKHYLPATLLSQLRNLDEILNLEKDNHKISCRISCVLLHPDIGGNLFLFILLGFSACVWNKEVTTT